MVGIPRTPCPKKSSARGSRLVTGPLGTQYHTPLQRNNARNRKDKPVVVPGRDAHLNSLRLEIEALKLRVSHQAGTSSTMQNDDEWEEVPLGEPMDVFTNPEIECVPEDCASAHLPDAINTTRRKRNKREEALRLSIAWEDLISRLVEPFLEYVSQSTGTPTPSALSEGATSACTVGTCSSVTATVLCLHWDHHEFVGITYCPNHPLQEQLIRCGLFPTSPTEPRMAVSIRLLEFYYALFEKSGDAVMALSAALKNFYVRCGFPVVTNSGDPIESPFRKGLAAAIQWFDKLRICTERTVQFAIERASEQLKNSSQTSPVEPNVDSAQQDSFQAECSSILQRRCPACFGGDNYGRSFDEGGDVHLAIDANFHHRHRVSAGDTNLYYDPEYFISKSEVDAVGERIAKKRPSSRRPRHPAPPDNVVQKCQDGHEAANNADKAHGDNTDDKGAAALVCRHDIPIFLANVDTPGEQQKYAVALIEHVLSLMPETATVVFVYDIGCVVDRSLHLYEILPDSVMDRIIFATSAMHAYGHEWTCQLVYNPRLRVGLGLTDGEGVERLWSKLRRLIPLTRSSSRSRRIWLLDRQSRMIHLELREHLGRWVNNRLRKGVQGQGGTAREALSAVGIPEQELRAQWESQKAAQLSVRAHAPARLRKEIDAVLTLQAEVDRIDTVISNTRSTIKSAVETVSPSTFEILEMLEKLHGDLIEKIDVLYTSLDVPERFPSLTGASLEFVRFLLLARDLKTNIRKRAIASFLEWERLDRAVGGRSQPLGTRLHQQTRKSITKRAPALIAAIRKFNGYCDKLAGLKTPACTIPVPHTLSTKLEELRSDEHLMEDVWVIPMPGGCPRWLEDEEVRKGILALLKLDRTKEEEIRLSQESGNLLRWFSRELAAIELALVDPANASYRTLLLKHREGHLLLKSHFATVFTPKISFESAAEAALRTAHTLAQILFHIPDPPTQRTPLSPSNATLASSFGYLAHEENHLSRPSCNHRGDHPSDRYSDHPQSIPIMTANHLQDYLDDSLSSDVGDDLADDLGETEALDDRDSSQIILADILEGDDGEYEDQLHFEDIEGGGCNGTSLEVPASKKSDELNSQVPKDLAEISLELFWEEDTSLQQDSLSDLPSTSQPSSVSASLLLSRLLPAQATTRQLDIDGQSLARIMSPTRWLNDVCVNEGALLLCLQGMSVARDQCAIFTSFALDHSVQHDWLRYFWKTYRRQQYWGKDIWIFPINYRNTHWMLCSANMKSGTLALFDSFADEGVWHELLPSVIQLINVLVNTAQAHGHAIDSFKAQWIARPLTVRKLQHNGYDCGVWVLATIAAILRGYDTVSLDESRIRVFREYMSGLFLQIPVLASGG